MIYQGEDCTFQFNKKLNHYQAKRQTKGCAVKKAQGWKHEKQTKNSDSKNNC